MWNKKALREAVINAFVHNDYTTEQSPTIEIYPDRLEMRIFSDLDLVESLGMGIPRIVAAYGIDCFVFSDNYIKMIFPTAGIESNLAGNLAEVPKNLISSLPIESISILNLCNESPKSKPDIFNHLKITNQKKNRDRYLLPLLENNLIEPTIKDKPTSPLQKYITTPLGKTFILHINTDSKT